MATLNPCGLPFVHQQNIFNIEGKFLYVNMQLNPSIIVPIVKRLA